MHPPVLSSFPALPRNTEVTSLWPHIPGTGQTWNKHCNTPTPAPFPLNCSVQLSSTPPQHWSDPAVASHSRHRTNMKQTLQHTHTCLVSPKPFNSAFQHSPATLKWPRSDLTFQAQAAAGPGVAAFFVLTWAGRKICVFLLCSVSSKALKATFDYYGRHLFNCFSVDSYSLFWGICKDSCAMIERWRYM